MNAADRRRLTPALGAAAGVLALVLIALWAGAGRGAHWNDSAAPPKLPPIGATVPGPKVPPLQQYAAIWEQPLFNPGRAPEPFARQRASSGNLRLTGVIMLPGLKMAIVHDETTGKDYRVVEGRPAPGGPALLELHPRSAVLSVSGSRRQLELVPAQGSTAAYPEPAQSAGGGTSDMVSRGGAQDPGRNDPERKPKTGRAGAPPASEPDAHAATGQGGTHRDGGH